MIRLIALITLAACATALSAQTWLGASANQTADATARTHAWVIGRSVDSKESVILHLPPRGVGDLGAPDGTVRLARTTGELFDRASAHGSTLWLVGKVRTGPSGRTRPIRSIHARAHSAIRGSWLFEPAGRLAASPALTGDGTLLAMGAFEDGPAVVLKTDSELSLLALRSDTWTELPLPELGARVQSVALIEAFGSPVLAVSGPESTRLWLIDGPIESGAWRSIEGALPAGATESLVCCAGSLAWSSSEGGRSAWWRADLTIAHRSVSAPYLVASTQSPPTGSASVSLASSGRLLWVWSYQDQTPESEQRDGPARSFSPSAVRVAELSAYTGRTLHDGRAVTAGPISIEDFRVLAATLVGATVLVLVLVIRGDSDEEKFSVPDGCALAEPGRRLAGALVDLLAAAAVTSILTQARVIDLVSLTILLQPGGGQDLGIMIALGFVGCTLFETVFSASPGKLLFGMRVAKAVPGRAVPAGPVAAAARNLIKWALPPLAGMVLIAPSGRHRGDAIGGAVVVVPTVPDQEPTPPAEG